jgi:uncharacterized protein (DUF362 family)
MKPQAASVSFPVSKVASGKTALAGCRSYAPEAVQAAVDRLFELPGGVERFAGRGERVLIKPNLIVPAGDCGPAQTHPAVILAIARRLKEAGAKPMVGDSPAWQDTAACLRSLGVMEELEKLGVPAVQLDEPVRVRIEGGRIGISRKALEADKIINVPKFKAHQQLGATFAVKNMYGCVTGKEKALRHFTHGGDPERFCRMLIGIYARLAPVLNIIDAVTAMEGQGPIHGTPKELGVLIGGEDPIACERVCCAIAGLDPEGLPILRTARRLRFGCHEPEVVGDALEGFVCRDFQPAVQTPLRFTLPRICRSVAKQALMLIRNRLGSGAKN